MAHPVQPSTAAAVRGPLRRYLEARGVLGGFDVPTVAARVRSRDGTRLAGSYLAGVGGPTAVMIAHGFGANRRKPAYVRLAQALARRLPVLSLDLRGHGRSEGRSTFGDAERHDVLGGIDWLRGYGHRRVVLVGVSMGATAVVRAAATLATPNPSAPANSSTGPGPPRTARSPAGREQTASPATVPAIAGLVTISGPAWFRERAPQGPLQRLETVWHSPVRRAGLQVGLGVRLDAPAAFRAREHPVESMSRIAVPALVVHGEDDPYFPLSDAEALAAAGRSAVLWNRGSGFGHAEDGFGPVFLDDLARALVTVVDTGRFPAHAGG